MRVVVLIFYSTMAFAQDRRFEFGLTGGVPLNTGVHKNSFTRDETRRYSIGPVFEYRFTPRISMVVNPLYKRQGSSVAFRFDGTRETTETQLLQTNTRTRAHVLEVPILGKYYFLSPLRSWRPFATAGISLTQSWLRGDTTQIERTNSQSVTRTYNQNYRSRLENGTVVGGGLDFRRHRLHFSPEFRYTFSNPSGTLRPRHQAEGLVSIRF